MLLSKALSAKFHLSNARTWVEVRLDALRANVSVARSAAGPEKKLMAVIKADAYGHGLERIAVELADHVDVFGVAHFEEARTVARALNAGKARSIPILLLSPALPLEYREIVEDGWEVSVSNIEELDALDQIASAQNRQVGIHLVVDTGMGRMGFVETDLQPVIDSFKSRPGSVLRGIATHLPSADEDQEFTQRQLGHISEQFGSLSLPETTARHVLNSAGILSFPGLEQTMVRPGLILYGLAPAGKRQDELTPILSWKTRVTLLRWLPEGSGVSYGRTFVTSRRTLVATLGVGYGDGYPHQASGKGAEVLIRGHRCKVVGRVTMDQMMVDVTPIADQVSVSDSVILLGEQGEETIDAHQLARVAGTIPWVILTQITKRVRRVYLDD